MDHGCNGKGEITGTISFHQQIVLSLLLTISTYDYFNTSCERTSWQPQSFSKHILRQFCHLQSRHQSHLPTSTPFHRDDFLCNCLVRSCLLAQYPLQALSPTATDGTSVPIHLSLAYKDLRNPSRWDCRVSLQLVIDQYESCNPCLEFIRH